MDFYFSVLKRYPPFIVENHLKRSLNFGFYKFPPNESCFYASYSFCDITSPRSYSNIQLLLFVRWIQCCCFVVGNSWRENERESNSVSNILRKTDFFVIRKNFSVRELWKRRFCGCDHVKLLYLEDFFPQKSKNTFFLFLNRYHNNVSKDLGQQLYKDFVTQLKVRVS